MKKRRIGEKRSNWIEDHPCYTSNGCIVNCLKIVLTFLLIYGALSCMKRRDARRLTHKTWTELRKRAATSVQSGQSPEIVALAFDINRVTIYGGLLPVA